MVSYTYSLAHGMDGWKGLLTGLGKHATIKCRIHYTKQRAHKNMKVLKAYRKGPGGTGCLYIEGLRRQDGREICRLLIWEFIPVQ